MYQIIEQVCSSESEGFSPRGLPAEGEVGGQVKIGDEAEGISQCISYIDVDNPLQYKIQSVVQSCCKDAHHYEAYKFR